jgi:hypothetical protein
MTNSQFTLTAQKVADYVSQKNSFVKGLTPHDAIHLPTPQVLYLLEQKLGKRFHEALSHEKKVSLTLGNDPTWLKTVNMVGINVRTIKNFWNIIKYALTLPVHQNSIHLLPIWEPGVVASLYGMSSWVINDEFFSHELFKALPHLNTTEKQLKVVVNLLHALGKTVGMDVIPHTDRFSEQVLANPCLFEWLCRKDTIIVDHRNNLHEEVETLIFNFLKHKKITNLPKTKEAFFYKLTEKERLIFLFGDANDIWSTWTRQQRRIEIIDLLYQKGFETIPATMAPPYRGLAVDMSETAKVTDEKGRIWRDFRITQPQPFSRVFGPLARYKFYENKDNNENWEIDFEKPFEAAWQYVAEHYGAVQSRFNFDFMRGDMAHVQQRPEGVPPQYDKIFYDILAFVKQQIATKTPHFASFAETFLAPPDEMAFGNEIDHLEFAEADATLGDLQSMVVGSPRFMAEFRRYLDIAATRQFTPCFTMMTADKDDPRFDEFYWKGNEARYFIGTFLTDMLSYMALGFECRDTHLVPAPNEYYTKLYVFLEKKGNPKAVESDYIFGKNNLLFNRLEAIKEKADTILPSLKTAKTQWLLPPDPTGYFKVIAWTQAENPKYVFVANLNLEADVHNIKIPFSIFSKNSPPQYPLFLSPIFSTYGTFAAEKISFNGKNFDIGSMEAGEGKIFQI